MAKYIKITQDNTHTENVTSDVIERLYNYCVGGIEDNSNIIGKVKTTYAYDDECKYLTNKFSDFSIMVGEYYARITDDAARTIILSKWGESDGKHVLASKLATVNSLESVFANTSIKDAKWLSYFTKVTNLSHTFSGVTSTTLDGLEKLDTSMVTNMQNTFGSCKMTKLDVSGWDVSHVTSMSGMFTNIAAEELDLTSWNISSITGKTGMFRGARNLKEIKGFESCNISTIAYQMFFDCPSLALTSLPEGVTSIGSGAFDNCTKCFFKSDALKNIKSFNIDWNTYGGFRNDYFENRQLILGENCAKINVDCFTYAHVDKVKILATTPPVLARSNAFYNEKWIYMQIYVPDASLDAYKTANEWKKMAEYIHPMSEWTD